eukprot:TRINITY_DN1626_c0_g1_i12.p2 TRINITY_DN1626_c0_g1~~TRINITY_DN1626_c0_g1_i12.p2  ORF type:complete len:531 (+),score=184.60 TRINITY_DN1626_c0_g1_i12:107-1594(+)
MRQAVLLALAAGASGLSEEYVRRNGPVLWEYWKDIHKTGYSAVEEPKRYKNFLLNMIAAAYVEREKPFLACTANKYADLSKDEFQAQHPQHAQQLKLAPMEQYGVSSPGDEVHCAVAGNEQEVCHIPGHPDAELFGTGKVGALDAKMECSRMTARRKQVGGASESRFTIGEVFRTMDTYCPVPAVAPGIDCKRNSRPSQTEAAGIVWQGNHTVSPLPHETIADAELPDSFTWCNKDGVNYCTMSRNQHIPQYCGSCWAHGAVSALGDRIKIARKGKGPDINLAVQHMLNCQGGGSCHGGSVDGPYQWIHGLSKSGGGIAYETEMSYSACSSDSQEGFCPDSTWDCKASNVARTCSTFTDNGGHCAGLNRYPNATVAEHGSVSGSDAMQKEIYARGPISCGVHAVPLHDYTGGVIVGHQGRIDHVVSIVGWGTDPDVGQYWLVRNSWGEYWGEGGYFRSEMGRNTLSLESGCSWAVPGAFTDGNNFPCYEGGENCA